MALRPAPDGLTEDSEGPSMFCPSNKERRSDLDRPFYSRKELPRHLNLYRFHLMALF